MPPVPSTIGRYQVIEEIGHGGMGVLYRARDPLLDREVALKVLLDFTADGPTRERLAREARAAAHLQHRNIVTIHDFGESDGLPYIAMELLGGQDLETTIRTHQPIDLAGKIDIAIQLCDALSYAHDHGIVHRDVKPSNVRVLEDGTVKVLDFGIARFAPNATTESVKVTGTPRYMAPEQITGQPVDGRTDVFSAGALIYALFSGAPPFDGKTVPDILHEVLHATPVPLQQVAANVPERVAHIVARALEKDPANRYARASDMAAELRAFRQTRTDGTLRTARPEAGLATTTTTPRRIWAWVAAGVVLLGGSVTVLGLSGYLGRGRSVAPPVTSPTTAAPVEPSPVARTEPADSVTLLTAVLNSAKELMRSAEKSAAKGVAADYHSIIDACTQVINALMAKGQDADTNLLAAAFELRARARLATGDRAAAASDFTELLKIVPTWALDADVQPNVAIVFEQVRTTLNIGAPPPPPPPSPTPRPAPAPPPPVPTVSAPTVPLALGAPSATDVTSLSVPPPAPPPTPRVELVKPPQPSSGSSASARSAMEPKKRKDVKAEYPADAVAAHKTGTVYVDVTIGPDGRVIDAKVIKSEPLFDKAALDAVRQWEYEPTIVGGVAVSVVITIGVKFSIDEPEGRSQ